MTFDNSNITQILNKIEKKIQDTEYGSNPETLYEPIRYIMKLGGKRMRPLLAILSYQLFQDDITKIITPATGIEVFHNFTLMHDDIMDEAPLRRGKQTVHEKWNPDTAILSGDVMLVIAYKMIMEVPDPILREVINAFNACAAGVCEGQQIDMDFESKKNVSVDEYLNMIRLKTAVLLGFSLKLGAMVGGAQSSDIDHLYKTGINMGNGFQLKDDILDVFGDQEKFGKQVGGDIIANKKTYLLISALEEASKAQKDELHRWLEKTDFDPEEKVSAVKDIYDQLNIRSKAEKTMNQYFNLALSNIDYLHTNPEKKQHLKDYVEFLIGRES